MKVRIVIPPKGGMKKDDVVDVSEDVARGWLRGKLAVLPDAEDGPAADTVGAADAAPLAGNDEGATCTPKKDKAK